MAAQETQGLLSPWVRDVRLKQVARLIKPQTALLDLGCGQGYLARHLPASCRYFGVDRIPFTPAPVADSDKETSFLKIDLLDENSPSLIEQWLPETVDYITVIAFLEHLQKPEAFLHRFLRCLKPGGLIIGTTPHPVGRLLHEGLARLYLCSKDGAEEHEDFLDKHDLAHLATHLQAKLIGYHRFLFGLNQLFVLQADG